MAEYIDKKQAIDRIASCYCMNCEHSNGILCRACEHQDDMDLIDDMPAADVQPVDRWISVDDRLPPIEKLYSSMVCICCTRKGYVLPLRYVYTTVRKKEVYRWERMDGALWGDDVAYWQPLPEPPKQ